jgi:cell division protein ZapA
MAQIDVEVNGRRYPVGCEDGQEQHLQGLARLFDAHVREVGKDMGQLGETRLFLMGALMMADELAETRGRLEALEAKVAKLQGFEAKAVQALESAAERIEKLAAD